METTSCFKNLSNILKYLLKITKRFWRFHIQFCLDREGDYDTSSQREKCYYFWQNKVNKKKTYS